MEEASRSAGRVAGVVRMGSRGDGQRPSCREERTWLLYPQVHCPPPCPKQLIFNISIPWLIFKHGSFPDKFFRGAFAVGLGGSRLSWQRTGLSKMAALPSVCGEWGLQAWSCGAWRNRDLDRTKGWRVCAKGMSGPSGLSRAHSKLRPHRTPAARRGPERD